MRENSDIEDDNINTTDLEKTELVKTKNLLEEEPPLHESHSLQQTNSNRDQLS